jgi:hypothetical protein
MVLEETVRTRRQRRSAQRTVRTLGGRFFFFHSEVSAGGTLHAATRSARLAMVLAISMTSTIRPNGVVRRAAQQTPSAPILLTSHTPYVPWSLPRRRPSSARPWYPQTPSDTVTIDQAPPAIILNAFTLVGWLGAIKILDVIFFQQTLQCDKIFSPDSAAGYQVHDTLLIKISDYHLRGPGLFQR